jgi:hypothetical protein
MTVSVSVLGERALRRLGIAVVPVENRPPLAVTVPAATIATNALTELGVIASDETPLPSDQALALAKVNSVHDSLVANANVSWTVDAIPQATSEEYTRIAGVLLATSFGRAANLQEVTMLEQRVRRVAMIMQAPDEATTAVMNVHNGLAALGKVRWSVFDIPTAAEMPYTILAAALLAPSFEMQANPQEIMAANAMLAKMIALGPSGERVMLDDFAGFYRHRRMARYY